MNKVKNKMKRKSDVFEKTYVLIGLHELPQTDFLTRIL